jgi:hypothetical protein
MTGGDRTVIDYNMAVASSPPCWNSNLLQTVQSLKALWGVLLLTVLLMILAFRWVRTRFTTQERHSLIDLDNIDVLSRQVRKTM